MSAAAKLHTLPEHGSAPKAPAFGSNSRGRVARDFVVLLGIALGIGLIAGIGMMLTVLLIA